MNKRKIVVLTGAGVSEESGISTFRDAGGLWEGHDIMEVASPEGWAKNAALVLEFYNKRRAQLFEVEPNQAHIILKTLESDFEVEIVTQNVDDLHERAGSESVIHLHGELRKVRSTGDQSLVYKHEGDINIGDLCDKGYQLRPHIVWFGESVPMIETAIDIVSKADILIIIGTSMQVYPAASLIHYIQKGIPVYYIDPNPADIHWENLTVIKEKASKGMELMWDLLMN